CVGGEEHRYRYYLCGGRRVATEDGKACRQRPVSADGLEQAVWEDVCRLLQDPAQVATEYERRMSGENETAGADAASLKQRIAKVKKTLARLIDAYTDGLVEKEEFEPRVRAARQRLTQLEGEAQAVAEVNKRRAELRLVLGQLQEFAERVQEGLQQA